MKHSAIGYTEVTGCGDSANKWCCGGSVGQDQEHGLDFCTTNQTVALQPFPYSAILCAPSTSVPHHVRSSSVSYHVESSPVSSHVESSPATYPIESISIAHSRPPYPASSPPGQSGYALQQQSNRIALGVNLGPGLPNLIVPTIVGVRGA